MTIRILGARCVALVAAGLLSLTLSAPSLAVTIGIDFQATNNGGQTAMGAGETAGFVPQQNWNSFAANASPQANLKNSLGAITGANVTYSGGPAGNNYTIGGAGNNAAGNQRMLNGYLDTDNTTSATVSISGLSTNATAFSQFVDVIVYTDGDGTDNRFGTYTIGSTALLVRDNTNATSIAAAFDDATLDQIGNYIVFKNVALNGSGGFLLTATPTSGPGLPRAPINGLQIFQAELPEPASIAIWSLIGLGMLALGWRQIRRK